jgi:iron complex outermembrane receptor protein
MKSKSSLRVSSSSCAMVLALSVTPAIASAQVSASAATAEQQAAAPAAEADAKAAPIGPGQASTDPAASASEPQQEAAAETGEAQDIIVTGTAVRQRRFDVSYAINALSQEDVKRLAPQNMADLVGKLPGIQVESTGGDVGNVSRVRGIPTDDGYLLFQQDGLPLYQDILGSSFKGDTLNRYDLMTDRLEVVRGGPAPVFASQAAAIANSVTVTGGATPRGKVQLTAGTTDLYRLDAVQSGPLGDHTFYAVGGFVRRDGGQRPNGFTNDRGGQIRANIKHDFEGGSVKVTGLYLNDHNVYYLPIPIADPRNPTVSLDPYIDYFKGTLNTPALRAVTLKYLDGAGVLQSRTRDLANGRHTQLGNVGLHYEQDFNDWQVSAKVGYTKGKLDFDGFYSTSAPVDAAAFAAGYIVGNGANAVAARSAFPTATRLGYAIAGTNGAQVYDPSADSGLVMQAQYRAITAKFYSGQGDLSVTRHFETGFGTHDLKLGLYGAAYGINLLSTYQDNLIQVRSQPATLDLVAYNAAGAAVGSITDKGVLRYTTTLIGGDVDTRMYAFYGNDTWEVVPGFKLDGGIRHEIYNYEGYSRLTAGNVNLGDPTTQADNATVRFTGALQNTSRDEETTSWTLGANYDVTRHFGGYARASHLEAPPSSGLNVQVNQLYVKTKANQYEVGVKASFGRSYLYLTGFYTRFDPFNSTFVPFNPTTGQTSAAIPFVSKITVKGVEADGALNLVRWFSLAGSLTVQDPYYSDLQTTSGGASSADVEGKQVIREPKIFGNIRPSVTFDAGDVKLDVYGRYEYVGKRYVDFLNVTQLPAYDQVSAGVTATYGTTQFQVVADNLTNSKGLTEGNNRVDQLSGQGTREAIYGRPVFGRTFRFILSKSW